jgi:N-acetylneuraminic acid mutarotase
MPTPRQMLAAARGADGRIYVIGGVPRYGSAESLATVEIYDPATNSWSEGPSLRTPRHGHAAVATHDGRVYVIGGVKARLGRSPWMLFSDDPYSHSKPLASVEVLDTGPRR